MSYRAFKHLLGETSLERKCRFLFGAGILVLITASFWLYAYQTEHLAYNQTTTTCRVLTDSIFTKIHQDRLIAREQEAIAQALKKPDLPAEKRVEPEAHKRHWDKVKQSNAETDRL